MIINLADINPEGEEFAFSRATGELNSDLNDLIKENDYTVQFTLRPLDQGYELFGSAKTQLPEICSRCGINIQLKIDKSFKELLLPKLKAPAHGDKYSRVNHFTDLHEEDSGPSITEVENGQFNVGEFIHEFIGLQIPIRAVGETDEKGDCQPCGLNVETTDFGYNEDLPAEKNNPFDALKNIKLN